MKKGFLLSETKVPRSRDAPSTSADADGCRSAANIPRQRQSSGIRRRQRPKQHQPTTIKRGFLLGSSKFSSGPRSSSTRHLATDEDAPRPFNNCDKSLPPLPQCRPREGGGSLSTSRSERVVTRSNALLDTSFNEIDSSAEDDEYNQQFQPAASSSLLQIVRDESDADEGETPFHCENNDALLHHEGQKDDNPSLDSWIEPSLESSTLPSIILPSSTQHSRSSQRIPCNSKQRKPLIVEMDDNPRVREATSRNLTPLVVSSNDAVGPCQNDRAVIDNRKEEIGTRTEQQHQCPADADSGDSIRKVVPTPKDSFQFTNAVSIILSKLDRSIRSNSHHKNSHPDNCRDPSVIGVGTIVNTHTETMIQSFVTKHLSSNFELLNNIWSVILDEIAQDCTEFIQSKKKKRSRSHNISPSLTLGLGILELLSPREAAYESLVRQLLLIETSQGGSSQDTQGRLEGREKQQKVLALGAVYLLRCRIRCINISLTNMELGMADSSKIQESIAHLRNEIELEIGILLSKILPSLENIVNGNASNGQTVLTSAAADTCFELIEISSRSTMNHQRFRGTSPSEMTDSMKKWKSVLPLIERLMAAKQRWVNSSASSDQSDDNLEMNGCSSRTTCTNAVLIDWFDTIKSSKRLYFDYLVGNGLLEGCDHSAASNFFVNLSGILLRKSAVGKSSEVAYFRGGGIAQSLCQHKECIFGSIISPIYGCDSDVVTLLHDSCKLTDNIRDTRRNNSASPDAFTKINHQRSAVRSFASWISSGNKAIRILTKSNQNPDADVDLLDSSMVSLVLMLRSESKQCVDLSIASL